MREVKYFLIVDKKTRQIIDLFTKRDRPKALSGEEVLEVTYNTFYSIIWGD